MPAIFPTYPDFRGNGAALARMLSNNGVKTFGCDLNISAAEYTIIGLLKGIFNHLVDPMITDGTNSDDATKFVNAEFKNTAG